MRSSLRTLAAIPLGVVFLGANCANQAILETGVGPFSYTISASQISIPPQFVDSSNNTIRSIACTDDTMCPQLGAGQPADHCVNSVCTPDPFPFTLTSSVIDLDQNATVQRYGNMVTDLEVRAVDYAAMANGLGNPVGPTDLYWGPPDATDPNSPGVGHLGTIPVVTLPPNIDFTPLDLDQTGVSALSDYLLHTAHQFRLFARPSITLVPGGPVPMGDVTLQVQMQVHIEGRLVQ